MKKISVIIPCYNVESYIDRCMKSIMVQTIGIENLEIICIDDASADDTWGHLQKWEQTFPENVLLIRQDVNRRQGAARNIGLRHASADWVAFVDADDWLEPDYFEQLYTPTKNFVCDVVGCNMIEDYSRSLVYFKENDREGGEDQYIRSDTVERKKHTLLWKPLSVYAWMKIIRKKLLLENQIYFPEDLVYEDNYWHPLLYIYADHIYLIGKKLYHYFMHSCSTIHARNEEHHLDRLTVQMMKWEDYGKRGLLQTYREELEYDLLCHAIFFMKTLVLRYNQPSFSHYQLQREIIRERIPDYVMSSYTNIFSGIDRVCLDAISHPLNKSRFLEFAGRVRKVISTPNP